MEECGERVWSERVWWEVRIKWESVVRGWGESLVRGCGVRGCGGRLGECGEKVWCEVEG